MTDRSDTSSSSIQTEINARHTPTIREPFEEKAGLSLLDFLLLVAQQKRIIGLSTVLGVAIALVVALTTPSKYSAAALVIRETISETSSALTGGLAALSGLGINIGSGTTGLGEETYEDILKSNEVLLTIAKQPFFIAELNDTINLVGYYNPEPGIIGIILAGLKKITIGLPRTMIDLVQGKPDLPESLSTGQITYSFNEEEKNTVEVLSEVISAGVSRQSGIMTISVTTTDPLLSAQLASVAIKKLAERVREIYHENTKQDLEFVQERFSAAQAELNASEEALARFTDQNRDPQTANLLMEMERLQRQVDFKTQLYSELQAQLTQTEIDLQKNRPVLTVVEAPVPPLESSGPRRKVMVLAGLVFGFGAGLGLAFLGDMVKRHKADDEAEAKLKEIQVELIPAWVRNWLGISS
ncbi:MAG: hypothetical protein JSW54_03980 [Fidelibacterota bacterium]|nr:MAG: hypothetical protein JSW54_03980 [Candidatus Neomarinimicrobiota bacterium]